MSEESYLFLSKIQPFSALPKKEIQRLAELMVEKSYPGGHTLYQQGKSEVGEILIVKSGILELYFNKLGEKMLIGLIGPGEIFGGISTFVNEGFAVRTVQTKGNSVLYALPKSLFLELSNEYKQIKPFFVDRFAKSMKDETYASVITYTQNVSFLSRYEPFSFLDEDVLNNLALELSVMNYPKDSVLFIQGRSRVEQVYIIQKGAAERYFEENEHKTLRGVMGEGDIYGGISLLLNNGLSTHTVRVMENTCFYILPKNVFLSVCHQVPVFLDYFTDTFGRRMLDRSYAAVVAKTIQQKDSAMQFFEQPVANIYNQNVVSCDPETSIRQAAAEMTEQKVSSIFIRDKKGNLVGVVTDNDLRSRVIAPGLDIGRSVSEIMTTPLRSIPSQALAQEALLAMMQMKIKHLAVTDANNKVIGVVTNRDILDAQGQSPFFLIREISNAGSVEEIKQKLAQLPLSVHSLIRSGAKAKNVTRLITSVSDAVYDKLIGFALKEAGPPPNKFVFMIFGSDGRKEQTLKTDQDNAIMYENPPDGLEDEYHEYYLKLGDKVCTWLDYVGYEFCKGEVMAKNPQWCQSVDIWKEYFATWISTGRPEALLKASIFFDFRLGYGEQGLIDDLREMLFSSLVGWAGFFRNLTENALHFKPPLGFFRNFVVESKGEHRNSFNIKSAMQPLVDLARIYALKNKVDETNTQDRLHQIYLKDGFTYKDYNELEQSYGFLMQLRLVRQVTAIIEEKREPNNYINPKKLSRIEQTTLKEIFQRIEKFQAALSLDFTGII